ncbi:hypothetical protein M758_UG014100 [Ceratodon purpureus]|nr:hypothetical protein M758_UG014100 [Ceratodon purpureus]
MFTSTDNYQGISHTCCSWSVLHLGFGAAHLSFGAAKCRGTSIQQQSSFSVIGMDDISERAGGISTKKFAPPSTAGAPPSTAGAPPSTSPRPFQYTGQNPRARAGGASAPHRGADSPEAYRVF